MTAAEFAAIVGANPVGNIDSLHFDDGQVIYQRYYEYDLTHVAAEELLKFTHREKGDVYWYDLAACSMVGMVPGHIPPAFV
jgi:hypothetical protein